MFIEKAIEQFLASAQERNLNVHGNPEKLWFVIDGIKLDPCFNLQETPVMVRFQQDSNEPIVLIPEDVAIRPDAGISDTFFNSWTCIKGWRCIFPGLFLDVNEDVLELVFSVAGILANLSLYNIVSREDIAAVVTAGSDSETELRQVHNDTESHENELDQSRR
jgi:hypothetical protein